MDILIDEKDASLWVAAVREDRFIEGLEIDPEDEEIRWGSIYWAKVKSVDASLDAVYLDLDGDNTGILFNGDIRVKNAEGKTVKGGDKPIGKILSPGQMIAVQAKSGYMPSPDMEETLERKSPRMSMNITLPGRYLIFAPMMHENQISQRIKDKKIRKQMLEMLSSMSDINGCILRSASMNTQTDVLVREGKILHEMWKRINEFFEGDTPQLIMMGPGAIQRTLSDQSAKPISTIEIVTMEQYEAIEDWCELFAPDLMTKIKPIELENPYADLSLFYHHDIMVQIEKLFQSYAVLSGGGNIIIEKTAALTVIDVNKSGCRGSNLAINLEAASEIARNLRVRNLGGIVIVDFLKLKSKKDEAILIAALKKQFNEDPCTVQIHGMTALGLMEISRSRRTPTLADKIYGII